MNSIFENDRQKKKRDLSSDNLYKKMSTKVCKKIDTKKDNKGFMEILEYTNSDNETDSYANSDSDNSSDNEESNNEEEEEEEDNISDETSDTNKKSKDSSGKKKIRPIKTKKVALNVAIKTVDERSLYAKVDKFFRTECKEEMITKMINIINNNDPISLRLLNWFAMKHSAVMTPLEVIKNDKIELFDVKISYRARLNSHSKKYFDPFRRGKRFDYYYDPNDKEKCVETTLCQLNYFRWLFLHNLMDYIEDHFDVLKHKMGNFNNVEKEKKKIKKQKEKEKSTILKNKKEFQKIKVKKFNEDTTNKVVIVI